ncbi:MAG TPA: hypothetical protein VMW52_07330 [Phycisphaerae bacterium]|nr:hypothetical protein [Phycisphaerae bacterium]
MTDEAPDLDEELRNSAAGPQHASVDGDASSEHPLTSQIEVVKFQHATRTRKAAPFGLTFAKLKPHGASE